jgi:ABC-type polar amino acid transport system ATPase subunit
MKLISILLLLLVAGCTEKEPEVKEREYSEIKEERDYHYGVNVVFKYYNLFGHMPSMEFLDSAKVYIPDISMEDVLRIENSIKKNNQ